MTIRTTVDAAVLGGLLRLPGPVVRRLAGAPYDVDGLRLATDVQLTLRLKRLMRMPAVEELPAQRGREMMRRETATVAGRQPIGAVRDLEVAGMPARHYLPSSRSGGAGPLLLFFHGGGFVYGDLDTHDAPCRVLAETSGVPVLAVDYRLAPEHPFPAAFDDAEAAYHWVLEHADEVDLDPARLAVGGDSAGGNLAAWIGVHAARSGTPLAWQLLIYPVTRWAGRDTASHRLFGEGLYLTTAFMDGCEEAFLVPATVRDDERLNLLTADLPAGMAPAYVATAGFDVLRDEGERYAARLAEAGVAVGTRRFTDQIHGFLNVVGAGRTGPAAVREIATRLRDALA